MILSTAQELSFSTSISILNPKPYPDPKPGSHPSLTLPMRKALFSSFSLLRPLALSPHHRRLLHAASILRPPQSVSFFHPKPRQVSPPLFASTASVNTSVERLAGEAASAVVAEEIWDFCATRETEGFEFDECFASTDMKHLESPSLEVKELDELPEQWRRRKLAWLCKELPLHKASTLTRILNAQRKWLRQEDATYVAVHCTRIRENEAGFRVYKWMMQQHWFQFDFALATKLADYMGRERKFLKCREIFDDIINQGRVPNESTFHVLIIAYLSSTVQGCVDEACSIYNRMIQLGGYQPRLSLHNSLFRALVSKPGASSKYYLKQAEFIFHNLVTSGLEIHKDVYGGLIWLHSYQDTIDKERIASIREEMWRVGIKEGREVLLSILRACSRQGDVEEAEKTWLKLHSDSSIPSQAFVYKMEVYSKVGEPMKSLEIFREMQEHLGSTNVVAYHKIIEVLSKAQEMELAESLMTEFINSGMKPLVRSFIDLMNMYFNLGFHDKVESTFIHCLDKCSLNRTVYSIYLESLVKSGNLDRAEDIFNQMVTNGAIGVNSRPCNTILSGYLTSGDYVKAEKIYDLMCQKKYDIESPLMQKIDYVLSLSRKVVKKPISLKLRKEQREALVGLLLGGLQMESDEERKMHTIHFEFNENSPAHSILRRHIHNEYHEWLNSFSRVSDGNDDIPYKFSTISHSYFGFYADQFWPSGKPMIPKLIHRWMSPRVLAYWYMYGGHRSSSGDILLKLKGSREGAERVIKTLKAKSLDFRVKRKGRVFWIGFLGSNSTWFWKLTEPYILDDLKDLLRAGDQTFEDGMAGAQDISFDSGYDSDETASNHSDHDNL
ncbi:pentatricopeptide repeat-containing protein At2g15820, chloroplastic [Malania oleifera]|uniref:pentatricopeptide repeat-containing protein At2g15820, chloroplastic n=1 Tax=Malania oleifera TaxID=397392 RepID=UPI0025ADE0DD|nr:pentatricopeptide repeat-containing protein At2g15820, chloroplastic [Malania oleifera]